MCGHGWGKEQEQRHKPKESEEKCLLVTRNTKGEQMNIIKLEYLTIEKEDPPEPNTKNQEKPQPSTSEAMIICPDRGLERIDYKKLHTKGLDIQEKTEQAKFTKSEEYTQPSIEPTPQSQKKRWDDAMKTDLKTLMNENTHW